MTLPFSGVRDFFRWLKACAIMCVVGPIVFVVAFVLYYCLPLPEEMTNSDYGYPDEIE